MCHRHPHEARSGPFYFVFSVCFSVYLLKMFSYVLLDHHIRRSGWRFYLFYFCSVHSSFTIFFCFCGSFVFFSFFSLVWVLSFCYFCLVNHSKVKQKKPFYDNITATRSRGCSRKFWPISFFMGKHSLIWAKPRKFAKIHNFQKTKKKIYEILRTQPSGHTNQKQFLARLATQKPYFSRVFFDAADRGLQNIRPHPKN